MKPKPDVTVMILFFENQKAPGIATLIKHLTSPAGKGITYFGSNTIPSIGFNPKSYTTMTEDEAFEEIFFKSRSLYIGSRDGSVTPLEWLEKLSKIFEKLPPLTRHELNAILGDFAKVFGTIDAGDYEAVSDFDYDDEKEKNPPAETVH